MAQGNYFLKFSDEKYRFLSQYYEHAPDQQTAKPLLLIPGSKLTNIDANMEERGSITGTITMFNGSAPDSTYIDLYKYDGTAWANVEHQYVGAPYMSLVADYQFEGLLPGIYRMSAQLSNDDDNNLLEYYKDQSTLENSTDITVRSGTTISDINFVLGQDSANAAISGKVVSEAGLPVNLWIELYNVRQDSYASLFVYLRPNPDGTFTIAGLEQGHYLVAMRQCNVDGYITSRTYWPYAEIMDNATIISLDNTSTFSEVKFTLYHVHLPLISNQSTGR